MSFVDGSESVELTPERIKGLKFHSENKCTTEEAAMYWAGFARIGHDDINAMFDYETIFDMFFDACNEERLELCNLSKVKTYTNGLIPIVPPAYVITLSNIEYDFRYCEIDRESLTEFAQDIGKSPLPLFLKKINEKTVAKNKSNQSSVTSKRTLDKERNHKVICEEAQSLLNNAVKIKAYMKGDNLSGSAITEEMVKSTHHPETGYTFDQVQKLIRIYIKENKINFPE